MAENQKSFFALFQVGHIISLSFSNTFSGAMLIKLWFETFQHFSKFLYESDILVRETIGSQKHKRFTNF